VASFGKFIMQVAPRRAALKNGGRDWS
jgi:hypothetical protein